MTDEKLINKIAEIWVENGGDADGLDYCYIKIKQAIDKLTNSNK